LSPGETVVVIGIGGIGSSAVQLARADGATVIAVSRSDDKLELARRLGAHHVLTANAEASAMVRDLTGGAGADVVIQCADAVAAYELAVTMAGPGARIVFVGSSSEPFAVYPMKVIWGELALLGSRGFLPVDIEEAIELRLAGGISLDHLVESVRPLEEAQEALDDLRGGRVLRTVLVP
jgi:D-arabinose 1-dehydrogenase-like Zn-dependent alcohol dehydrogenase